MAEGYKVSPEDFIRAWQTSNNLNEVQEKLKMSYSAIASRANNYKKKGIPLKGLVGTHNPKLDIDKLKKLARDLLENGE